ncbi:hypothetical protein A1O3_03806 [Capronia epimyces CBS 606.96]|uniref:Uncharacterized protein n=1 Tax=Capronia epimyces CBS 606.96 TaxID=1182542 RepID=W9Y250_9EURO|nr:uncharacterized protein A1O3_03806 [Capronia epimyces CBS 606.96]EXJ86852.1 hypothetical protein A1O3_03806 [Capronia epimyces CBS 606.96]
MSDDVPWPPSSPRAALLSSPSGRRKYEAYQNSYSPVKRSATTPNLLDRLRAARKDKEYPSPDQSMEEDVEEDEETLQLKLAAIEARLKLKKLQQNKARAATPGKESSRPSSAHGPASGVSKPSSRLREPLLEPAKVEVAVSPTRRPPPAVQQRSPRRVLLGIDKGVRGGDVSLRRANTIAGVTRPRAELGGTSSSRPSSRSSAFGSARAAATLKSTFSEDSKRKTFGERMGDARERIKTLEQRRETSSRSRSKGFGLDQAELDKYRLEAEESRSREPPRSPPGMHQHQAYSRDDIVSTAREAISGTRLPKMKQAKPGVQASSSSQDSDTVVFPQADSSLFEGFSQLHLSSRILPHSFLKRTLPTDKFTIYRIPDLLRQVKSPDFELPDSVCDYVICGVIASKSSPMDHKAPAPDSSTVGTKDWERQWEDGSNNQRRFMVLTLTDLKWTVDLYLFGTALPRYHRLTPGTVVAILNPGIMPPKHGKTDTGAFSLTMHNGDDTILEIGTARDLGHCKTVKKDGKECGSWVNSSKTEICEWHLNAQLNKTRASRMGVNTGTNGFGGTGANSRRFFDKTASNRGNNGLLPRDGHRYDRDTGSHFYISRSNTGSLPGERRTGAGGGGIGLGLDDDDPFIPEGQLSRDRDARLRKHFATQEKEREIAEKLGSGRYAGFGGAGAEYLRQKTQSQPQSRAVSAGGGVSSKNPAGGAHPRRPLQEEEKALRPSAGGADKVKSSSQRGAMLSAEVMDPLARGGLSRKRTATDVRLSPVKKKTRFVTPRGIREAGRESLGVPVSGGGLATVSAQPDGSGSGSDDELEIV